jgi:hypothetical protein
MAGVRVLFFFFPGSKLLVALVYAVFCKNHAVGITKQLQVVAPQWGGQNARPGVERKNDAYTYAVRHLSALLISQTSIDATRYHEPVQTGSSAFLLAPPTHSKPLAIYGPITGTFLAKPPIVPRKSPNRMKIPYSSTKKPTSGQRKRMSRIPQVNAAVPLSFWRRAKKRAVFVGPIIRVSPRRNRT